MANPKLTARSTDPLRAIENIGDLDLVILADGDPISLRANRTRTVEFLGSCRRSMKDDGVLIMRVGVGDTYLGGFAGDLLATLASTLKEVFPRVTAIPGEQVLLVAGVSEDPLDTSDHSLMTRRLDRPEIGDQLHPALLTVLLDDDRRTALVSFIDNADMPPNTLRQPRAVPIAARLHESRSGPALVSSLAEIGHQLPVIFGSTAAVAVVSLIALAFAGGAATRATAAAAVIGFTSMGWWMLLVATWQATRGSVYAEVGALTGVFMAGVAAGSWASHRSDRQVRVVPWILGAGTALSLLLATGLAAHAPLGLVPVSTRHRRHPHRRRLSRSRRTREPNLLPSRRRDRLRRRRDRRRRRGAPHRHHRHPIDRDDGDRDRVGGVGVGGDSGGRADGVRG